MQTLVQNGDETRTFTISDTLPTIRIWYITQLNSLGWKEDGSAFQDDSATYNCEFIYITKQKDQYNNEGTLIRLILHQAATGVEIKIFSTSYYSATK